MCFQGYYHCPKLLISLFCRSLKSRTSGAGEMAQQIKALDSKSNDLSLVLWAHMVEGESWLPTVVFWSPLACLCNSHPQVCKYTHSIKKHNRIFKNSPCAFKTNAFKTHFCQCLLNVSFPFGIFLHQQMVLKSHPAIYPSWPQEILKPSLRLHREDQEVSDHPPSWVLHSLGPQ